MLQNKTKVELSTIICWGCGHQFGMTERKVKMDDGKNLCMECFFDLMVKPINIEAIA